MKSKFIKLWNQINAKSDPIIEFNNLNTLYSKKRYYHNLSHIKMCLKELDNFKKTKDKYDFDLIELAIWYHDIIYDTKDNDNEEMSAKYLVKVLKKAKLSNKLINKTTSLILSTKHQKTSRKKEERLLQDIDLCIFGQSKKEFDKYENNIRKEYYWVPLEKYKDGRIKVLLYFLQKSNIYNTDFYRKKYEKKARINLKRSIKRLEKI
jgi:predicted metal-dependent HD superfamily phosphohydrolase